MGEQSDAFVVYVTYQGPTGTRFDKGYYVEHHLPLVMQSWKTYGLESVSAFFPAVAQDWTIAICKCCFCDEAAVAAAFGAPETSSVMADVKRFTDVVPHRARVVAL